MIPVVRY